jgi:hypothetical protein
MHLVRNRVVAKFARKGMTAREAFHAKPNAARHAEALDGLIGVLRTSGLEAAISREEQRQVGFVKTQCEKRDSHGIGARDFLFESWSRDAHGFWSRRSKSAVSVE